ncbi:tripartite tricarboxylate transporter substrate binding protein [Xylophilus rhododendri]|uniref:Tripartite tricarboxylate transporter substrate binding protein n=1 Tax=Xylophilus rhododendri TaxID=2697032 RepID=A0A857J311_9BURK|nr:tripartite tricarboxylate transporter substrate binding protein [Xylophilus rhododendri]QHI97519.1 tripartite tricarboxylate transporter substrate binding protein [Xylophilus rhododendri]
MQHSMSKPRRLAATGIAAALAMCAWPLQALAADAGAGYFSGKQIKVIVPNPAGGTSDILARILAPKLSEALGATVLVENRAGATGNLGSDYVAKAAPDGLTLLLNDIGSLAIAPSVFPTLPFDPVKDFAPVILVAYSPHILAASPSLPVKDVKELIALAKAKPNSINFAISGTGGANHLAGIDFAMRTGIVWTYVPYKGGSQAINDVMAGQADLLFNGMVATYPMVKGGKLKALAISSAKRFPAAPEIPTVAESAGLNGFETGSFQGIVAPAGTPAPVVATLHATVQKILATPEMQQRLQDLGAEYRPGTSASFGEFIKTEKARWAKVVKESGVKFD